MNCVEASPLIAAYADDEAGKADDAALRVHLGTCRECAQRLEGVRALKVRLKAEVPYFRAPPTLRERMAAVARAAPDGEREGRGLRWRWLTAGALAGSAATVLAWLLAGAVMEWRASEDLAVEAVNSHVRATLTHAAIQVASSDQHTVKPWLSARLDFAPPVKDLAAEGFALAGARLDFLDHRPVAALVYRYRDHVIDVYVRPQSSSAVAASRSVRGFNVVHAAGHGMDWFAVSDANAEALGQLVDRLSRDAAVP